VSPERQPMESTVEIIRVVVAAEYGASAWDLCRTRPGGIDRAEGVRAPDPGHAQGLAVAVNGARAHVCVRACMNAATSPVLIAGQ
jgi:hypothetical protein